MASFDKVYKQNLKNFVLVGYPLIFFYAAYFLCVEAWRSLYTPFIFLMGVIVAHIFLNSRKYFIGSWIYIFSGWIAAVWSCLVSGGIHSPMIVWVVVIPLLATLLIRWKGGAVLGAFSLLFIFGLKFTGTSLDPYNDFASYQHMENYIVAAFLSATIFAGFFSILSTKEHEKVLERVESEKHWSDLLLKNIREGVIVTNSFGVVVFSNIKGLEIFGYETNDSIISLKIGELIPDLMIDSGKPLKIVDQKEIELEGEDKNGDIIPLMVSVRGFEQKEELMLVFVVRDLTQQRELEKKLTEERAKSFHATQFASLGQMAGSIAHEINTPLGALLLSTNAMERSLEKKEELDLNKLQKHVELSRRIITRVAKTVKSLKNLGRSNDEDIFERLTVTDLMSDVADISLPMIEGEGIEFTTSIEPHIQELYINGNRAQLGQVILNCLNNSMQAIRDLDEKWIRLEVSHDSKVVIIKIIDSGSGIPDDVLPNLFTPFFTTKPVGEGTGIGLSISRKTMQKHKGLFYVGDGPNTCFVLELPLSLEGPEDIEPL